MAFVFETKLLFYNENCRCPACVNFNPQLERLQAATKNIPLKVVKVSDPNIRIK